MDSSLTLLKHAHILTMDSQGRSFPDGAIVFRGPDIEAVGPAAEILAAYDGQPRNEVDAAGMLVLPGLIDGHAHPTNQLLAPGAKARGTMTTVEYLSRVGYPLERGLSAALAGIGAKLCFAEMIRNGVTCFNDGGGEQPHAIADAAAQIGIRGTVTRSTRDYIPAGWPKEKIRSDDVRTSIAETEELIERWNGAGEGRLRAWCELRNPYTTSDELAREITALAKRRHVGIHGHLASNYGDRDFSRSLFGMGVIARYADLGVLGPHFYAAHMNELDDDEVKIVADRRVNITHCPIAYIRLAMGLGTKIPELVEAGLNFSIGTDGLTASGSADLFRVMFSFSTAYNEVRRAQNQIGAPDALHAATLGGAKANLWDSEIGSLSVGKRADLIVVDHSGPEWGYINRDLVHSIVQAGNGDKVRSVWVHGRQLMKDRVLLTVEVAPLLEEAKAGVNELFTSLGIDPIQ